MVDKDVLLIKLREMFPKGTRYIPPGASAREKPLTIRGDYIKWYVHPNYYPEEGMAAYENSSLGLLYAHGKFAEIIESLTLEEARTIIWKKNTKLKLKTNDK